MNQHPLRSTGMSTLGALLTVAGATSALSIPANATTLACQNYTSSTFLCMHTKMPLMSQGDTSNGQILYNGKWVKMYSANRYNTAVIFNNTASSFNTAYYNMGLLEYVNNQESIAAHKSYTEYDSWDPGWCGGVSSAMNLRTYALETGKTAAVGGLYLGGGSVNAFIYQTMKLVKTGLNGGGTSIYDVNAGYNLVSGNKSAVLANLPTQSYYAEKIPLASIPVCNSAGCHLIALHGMEGQNFVISDPWGSIYTVSYDSTKKTLNFLAYISKGPFGGDIPHYGNVATEYGMVAMTGYTTVQASPLVASAPVANTISGSEVVTGNTHYELP